MSSPRRLSLMHWFIVLFQLCEPPAFIVYFFTPEPSNVIILFFSSLHFCSLVVTASRRICHDPALWSNTFFHVYAAEMQRLVPVWTVPMASGADLHNSMLVFACWEGTLVSRQLLFAIRDSYWGRFLFVLYWSYFRHPESQNFLQKRLRYVPIEGHRRSGLTWNCLDWIISTKISTKKSLWSKVKIIPGRQIPPLCRVIRRTRYPSAPVCNTQGIRLASVHDMQRFAPLASHPDAQCKGYLG